MAELTVDMTYGTALFEAAGELDRVDQIREEADEILAVFDEEPDLQKFVNYPAISAEEKKEVLQNVLGGKVCEELLNFLYVLIDKRRIGQFPKIVRVYKDLVDHEEGVAYGTVYSATPLDEKRLAEIEEETSKLMQEKVRLTNEIDQNLMAGIKILVEGKVIDASYRKKFDEMASQLNIS